MSMDRRRVVNSMAIGLTVLLNAAARLLVDRLGASPARRAA